jgi:outer membrane protein OmpA-like peptidoglycan-associated protein
VKFLSRLQESRLAVRRVIALAAVSLGFGAGAVALLATTSGATTVIAPNAPSNVQATTDKYGGITVTWNVPANNSGGNPAYNIFDYFVYNTQGQLECNTPNNTPNATSCLFHNTDTTPRFGYNLNQSYQFYVVAHNVSGNNSPNSALSNAVTPTITPDAPTGVWVQWDYNNAHNRTGGDGVIYWTVPNDNGNPITGYWVTISTPNGAGYAYQPQHFWVAGANTNNAYFSGLVQGDHYNVTVQAVNQFGNSNTSSATGITQPWGNAAPSTPSVSDNSNGSVHISWNSPGNNGTWSSYNYSYGCGFLNLSTCWATQWNPYYATSYNVYDQNGNLVCQTTSTSCDTAVMAHQNSYGKNTLGYSFTVIANDNWAFGNYSNWSAWVYPTIWPNQIGNVYADTNNDGSVFLYWQIPADNGNTIVSYQAFDDQTGLPVCTSSQIHVYGNLAYCTTPAATSNAGQVAGLAVEQGVSFWVEVQNALGQTNDSNVSNTVYPFVGPITPTAINVVANNDGGVTVSWTPATQYVGSPIASYMAMANSGSGWFPICSVDVANGNNSNTCNTDGSGYNQLTPGTSYQFEVVAYNTLNFESDTNVDAWMCEITNVACPWENGNTQYATVTPAVRPGFGTSVTATYNNDGTITVSFNTPPSNDTNGFGYPITDIQVFLYGTMNPVCDAGTSNSCTFPVSNFSGIYGHSYSFYVMATNGTWDPTANLAGNPSVPPVGNQVSNSVIPTSVPNTTSITGAATHHNGTVTLTWSAAVDNGSAVTGYSVYDSNNNLVCTTTGALTCVTGALSNGVNYQFYVVATNAVGNSANGPLSSVVVPNITPDWSATPTASKNSDNSFTINWVAPATYGSAVNYTVYSNPGGVVVCHTTDLTCRTATQSAVLGTTYTFYVVATNTYGNSATSATTAGIGFLPGNVTVGFTTSTTTLSAANKAALSALAAKLHAGEKITITGFSSAGKSYSVARATAVANYLKSLKSGLTIVIVDGGASNAHTPSATVVVNS